MSRIGNKKIQIPANVKVEVGAEQVSVTGPKGTLVTPLFAGITIDVTGNELKVSRSSDEKEKRALHGLVRALLSNNIQGATTGFTKTLLLQGVGYRAQKKGNNLVMSLGFSHEVNVEIPSDVNIDCPEPTKVIVTGLDKQRVGQVSANIRSFKPPEPYKGKGIRYEGENVKRKAGKTGK